MCEECMLVPAQFAELEDKGGWDRWVPWQQSVIFIFTWCGMFHYADDSSVYVDDGTVQNVTFETAFGPLHKVV